MQRKAMSLSVEAGDVIPTDGEIIEGLASIDEAATTGNTCLSVKPAEIKFGNWGTKVLSDSDLGGGSPHSRGFLDKMIALAKRQPARMRLH